MSATQPSWSALFQGIASNIQEIVRSEIRLAKTEAKEEAQALGKAGVSLGAGLMIGMYAAGFIFLCVMFALALAVPWWAAALIVGILLGIVALALIGGGLKKLRAASQKRLQSVQAARETVQWAKNQGS
jgi:uncharacterized membrane protein YqjE